MTISASQRLPPNTRKLLLYSVFAVTVAHRGNVSMTELSRIRARADVKHDGYEPLNISYIGQTLHSTTATCDRSKQRQLDGAQIIGGTALPVGQLQFAITR